MSCPSANAAIQHKAGQHYIWSGKASNANNAGQDFTGWTIESHVKTAAQVLVEVLTVTWLDPVEGLLEIRSATDTSTWPTGRLLTDIKLTTPTGDVAHTQTVQIISTPAITL